MQDKAQHEFCRRVALADFERGPVQVHHYADSRERLALAERFGVLSVDSLTLEAAIRQMGRDIYRAEGCVWGQATQQCVVTLDPVAETICEDFCVDFTQNAALDQARDEGDDTDIEPFSGDSFDIGEVAAQHFALGLNPYPRAPDAEPIAMTSGPETAQNGSDMGESPFSVLGQLLRRDDQGG